MVQIYLADSDPFIEQKLFQWMLQSLSNDEQARALRYKFNRDAYNFVLGRLLIKKGLEAIGIEQPLHHLKYHSSGQPYLPDVYFSISHTEGQVICAVSKNVETGIDIEKVKPLELSNFTSFFTKKEWEDILAAPSAIEKFYQYWTRKESIIKALGQNLNYLHQIELEAGMDHFTDSGKNWILSDLSLKKGYIGAICIAAGNKNEKNLAFQMNTLNPETL